MMAGRKGQAQAQAKGGPGLGAQSDWMLSVRSIGEQTHEICMNLLNVRNGFKQIRDNMPYFTNPPQRAKSVFIDINEKLYGYICSIRVCMLYLLKFKSQLDPLVQN